MASPLTAEKIPALLVHSPYLARLLTVYPDIASDFLIQGADKTAETVLSTLPAHTLILSEGGQTALMRELRHAKGKIALLTAIADISGYWPLVRVTAALSDLARHCVTVTLDALLLAAHTRGEITLPFPDAPSKQSGVIILAMGKLGAAELNYSSDIDLMVFFERGQLGYKGRHNEQHFMNKLAHDLVHILQERTPEGYVFRTDLRLRPDPASTPPAISTAAAYYYYESVGQNWERAAMIKASAIAGDTEAGQQFLKNLTPFMWRRNLDFAAINDIHSIKRQMDARQEKDIRLRGHNVKLGIGGIREIEFFVQIHQLIWGGRQPTLRIRPTCDTLRELVVLKHVKKEAADTLDSAYIFLRTLEHRLQMVNDEQTHTVPNTDAEIANIAAFMGFSSVHAFEQAFIAHVQAVHRIYASSFRSAEHLGDTGNLVFTGVTHDPDTLATLRGMGYVTPETVSEIVMGWHHGSKRATRTKRARELITEIMPTLLKRLAETANPDTAFLRFNDFLTNLPAGVQLFSLFNANPPLLGLIADIMGSAPMLAEHLSKSPSMLDAVLYSDFYDALPTREQMEKQWHDACSLSYDFDDAMNALRRFRNEKQFQAGVQLLRNMTTAQHTGHFLANLAELMVQETLEAVLKEFERSYGVMENGRFAVIGLGKLGSREMTFHSDIDLVFIYDVPSDDAISSGDKGLSASVYYNRLAQRLINTLSAMERDGRLYEVDTRLRPSGTQGLLAVSLDGLRKYFDELAWTFEYMAFTKARPVAGNNSLQGELSEFIRDCMAQLRDANKLLTDVADMRQRILKTHKGDDAWDIKYVRGGLIDIDFIAQYLLLLHAPVITEQHYPGRAADIFSWLGRHGKMAPDVVASLSDADSFLGQVFNMLRLCAGAEFKVDSIPPGLMKILCESAKLPDSDALRQRLIEVERFVFTQYNLHLNSGGTHESSSKQETL